MGSQSESEDVKVRDVLVALRQIEQDCAAVRRVLGSLDPELVLMRADPTGGPGTGKPLTATAGCPPEPELPPPPPRTPAAGCPPPKPKLPLVEAATSSVDPKPRSPSAGCPPPVKPKAKRSKGS